MALPEFDSRGDLPPGVHRATLDEVLARFGTGTTQRQAVSARLLRVYDLARATGELDRLILFGSYITSKPDPNDVDIVLIMRNTFNVTASSDETKALFDHERATRQFGASVFWIRPANLLLETLDAFIRHWQIRRDQAFRGIVEIVP